MRKIISVATLVVVSCCCHAQVRFAIFAGPQTSTARYIVKDVKQTTTNKFGFHAGGGWKIFFDNHLFFSPSFMYSLKGYKVKFTQLVFPPDTAATDNQTSIHTLELAFLLQYDFGDNPSHVFIKAGPSVDFQLAGKERFHLKNGNLVKRQMPYGFAQYGRYTAGILMQLGYETKSGTFIAGQYHLGLGNINNADGGPSIKHRVFGLSIGSYLRKKS